MTNFLTVFDEHSHCRSSAGRDGCGRRFLFHYISLLEDWKGKTGMLGVLVKLGWFWRREWKRYTLAITLLIVSGILEVIPPMMIGSSIDLIYLGEMTRSKLIETLAILIGLILSSYVVNYVWHFRLFGGAYVMERTMRSRLMKHLLKMTAPFYERNRTGDLMAQATNDLSAIGRMAGFGILTLADSTLWMATLIVTMTVFISWKLTLMAILPLPIMAVLMGLYGKWIHHRFIEAQDAFGEMNDGVLETISGIRVTRAFVRERSEEAKFDEVTQSVLDKNIAVVRIDALFEPTVKIMVGASYLIGLGYGAYLVYRGELTIGSLVSFNVYLGMLIWPMFAIGETINVMQRGNASLDRVMATLGSKPDVQDTAEMKGGHMFTDQMTSSRMPAQAGDIEFHDVTFRYPSSQTDNLREVSFKLERGRTMGVVGRSGSGKTTLIKQLLREYAPGSGSVAIGGVPIDQIAMDNFKSWLGYVPQTQFLFSRTVRSNILFGRDEAAEEELDAALRDSAFQKDLAFLPEGLETLVGEKGVALSGGQKQRVSIARALIRRPDILLLDDALSAVDARTEAEIVANIRATREGKTTIITTHRLSAVQHADLIVVMDDGCIVERGTHDELIRLGGWYKQQYELQQLEQSAEDQAAAGVDDSQIVGGERR